ncbi:MAG: hypothetical protein ACSLFC_13350 [Desulfuromonadales bacterium]
MFRSFPKRMYFQAPIALCLPVAGCFVGLKPLVSDVLRDDLTRQGDVLVAGDVIPEGAVRQRRRSPSPGQVLIKPQRSSSTLADLL